MKILMTVTFFISLHELVNRHWTNNIESRDNIKKIASGALQSKWWSVWHRVL